MNELLYRDYFEKKLTPDDVAQLKELLRTDKQARADFARYALEERLMVQAAERLAKKQELARETVRTLAPRNVWKQVVIPLSLAAVVLLAASGIWWGAVRGPRSEVGSPATARVTEKVSGVRCQVSGGRWQDLSVGDGVRAGTRIETKKGGKLRFQYLGEETFVDVSELADLSVCVSDPSAPKAKKLELRSGKLSAQVAHSTSSGQAKQPGAPFVVLTPQARIEVKGTRFTLGVDAKATRLEVTVGLVGITRLSDGKSVDVAAGQYAVAAEGVELVALPLSPDALRVASGQRLFTKSKMPYGKVLFDDEFDTLENWDVIVGTVGGEARILTGDPAPYARLEKDLHHVQVKANPERSAITIESCVVLDAQEGTNQYVRLISKRPIEAERFVVEMRSVSISTGKKTGGWISDCGIDVAEDGITDDVIGKPVVLYGPMVTMHQWEFTPAPEQGENIFYCRAFREQAPRGMIERSAFVRSSYVRPNSKRIMLDMIGSGWRLVIDRVRVREILDDDVADSIQR